MYDLHGTELHFVHKRIGGAIGGFFKGGPVGAVGGFFQPTGGGSACATDADFQKLVDTKSWADVARICGVTVNQARRRGGRRSVAGGGANGFNPQTSGCTFPLIRDVDGECRAPGSPADISVGGSMGGAAVNGRYGPALAPDSENRIHRTCLPGMVLGDDSLCYNRRDIKNSERKYPKGRAPLLTGGERNCITKAARAARKIQRTEKQLQKLGMLKKPTRRAAPRAPQRLLGPAGPSIINGE